MMDRMDHLFRGASPDPASARRTHVRYLVVALATGVSFILYLHRFFPAFAERSIKEEMHLSDG